MPRPVILLLATTFLAPNALAQQAKSAAADPNRAATDSRNKTQQREESRRIEEALRAEEPKIEARIKRIDAELAALDRSSLEDTDWAKEWAGVYWFGDGSFTSSQLHLAPNAGVAFLQYGCFGLFGGDQGDVVQTLPDGLTLKLVLRTAGIDGFLSERMYFVKWGRERLLVPDWQMPIFINNYNEGGFTRPLNMYHCLRLVRDKESRRRVTIPTGRPQLPEPFAKLLVDKPVHLKVTKVSLLTTSDSTDDFVTHSCVIKFQGGERDGTFVGMKFNYAREAGRPQGYIRITSVDDTTSTGEFIAYTLPGAKPNVPAAGEVLLAAGEPPSQLDPGHEVDTGDNNAERKTPPDTRR